MTEEIKIAFRKCKEEKSVAEMKSDPCYKLGVQEVCKNCEKDRHKKYREAKKEREGETETQEVQPRAQRGDKGEAEEIS